MSANIRFHAGQIVEHRRFAYRGVIYCRDEQFDLTDEWYEQMAITRPPKDQPWYGVLVDNTQQTTYVAERNLLLSNDKSQVNHPYLGVYFDEFDGLEYKLREVN
ncbi:MAG: heat shock protein HspQ [Gammaproteobacteria bacterium]|nr:heat shock protein HspQ [Gammaproteobacteria bacterium]